MLHLSDEDYTAPTYFYPWVHYVVRNHHPARLAALPHLLAVPLGYKRGFLSAVATASAAASGGGDEPVEDGGGPVRHGGGPVNDGGGGSREGGRRRYRWNFVGQTHDKPTRRSMVRAAQTAGGAAYLRLTRWWDDPGGLPTAEFRRVLEQSDFTLCPRG